MYEILTKGGHPILGIDYYSNLEMSLEDYKIKMMNLKNEEQIVRHKSTFSPLAFKMMENLLNINPNLRYTSHKALQHPWITRDENDKIPMNIFEEMELTTRAYEKLKMATRIAFAMSLMNETIIKKDHKKYRYVNTFGWYTE